jgi:UDP-3-O-[3-hydroxymyristoyl] N-acetylglucosamine deacetylase/3-hydroxyacyl-[acyl-carrier-protein] dehydratase
MDDVVTKLEAADIGKVLHLLPHRYPFLLVDRVIDIRGDQSGTGIKNVTINEPYFQGHFPGEPLMPGVLQIEAMAQAAGILMLRKTSSEGKTAFFMSADKVKFRKAVRPGDQLVINAKLTKNRGNKIGVAECTCTVGGTVVSSGELMFSVMDTTGAI